MRYEKYDGQLIEPLIELDTEAARDFYDLIKDVYSIDDFYDINNYYENGEFYLVFDDESNIIGTFAYEIKDPGVAELKRLRIKKELREQGSRDILNFIETRMKSKGIRTLVLSTSITRESTRKFYAKMGFEEVDAKPFESVQLIFYKKNIVLLRSEKTKQMISCCGKVCSDCTYYPIKCQGCDESKGKPFWTTYAWISECPIYTCCINGKQYDHCGMCKDLACSRYDQIKKPNVSDIDHAQSIIDRISILKEL